jgi:DNA polymerase (family 10)
MTNPEIAAVFDQIADLLEFQGENLFRVRAYRNAARTIHDLPRPVTEILADPQARLTDIAGIGKDLAEKVQTLVETRTLPLLAELQAAVPESVLAIMRVPGLGPKRSALLFHELGVRTLDELRAACQAHRVQDLKGFGAKTEAAILEGIGIASEAGRRFLWADAEGFVAEIVAHMRRSDAVEQIEPAGSYRRGKETIGDLDFLVIAKDPAQVMDHFAAYPARAEILARGDTKMSIRLANKLQVDLRVVPAESFGAAWQYFTGSKEHNIVLRGLAKERKLKVNEYGVFAGSRQVAGRSEEEVYAALDLPCFPPEIREARFEFAWAEAGALPRLVETADIQGDLHAHSTWSDGLATIEEMVAAAQARGSKYIAITDHSQRTAMAHGLDARRLRRQWAEIDRLNQRLRAVTVLKGVEVDILEQGGLDLADDVLAEADWVVASVHFGQKQSRERITRRIVGALENPYVCVLAHPTGRLLTRRKPYEVDLEAVLNAAREHGKCLELNAHPMRLDLDDVACRMARERGVPVVLSTDAHSIDGLNATRYGVQQARRGGLCPADVANTRSWTQLKKLMGRR